MSKYIQQKGDEGSRESDAETGNQHFKVTADPIGQQWLQAQIETLLRAKHWPLQVGREVQQYQVEGRCYLRQLTADWAQFIVSGEGWVMSEMIPHSAMDMRREVEIAVATSDSVDGCCCNTMWDKILTRSLRRLYSIQRHLNVIPCLVS